MLRKRKVFIAPALPLDQGNGDMTTAYGTPYEAAASVYPITNGQEAQFYGVEPNNSFRLVLGWETSIRNGDGIWLDEVQKGKPPYVVVSSPRWMLTVQAVIKEATGWQK